MNTIKVSDHFLFFLNDLVPPKWIGHRYRLASMSAFCIAVLVQFLAHSHRTWMTFFDPKHVRTGIEPRFVPGTLKSHLLQEKLLTQALQKLYHYRRKL
jgi:hypothetical protein